METSQKLGTVIPFIVMPLFAGLMFVPRHLEYSDEALSIQFWFRKSYVLSWEELQFYGTARNVFLVQFGNQQAFQILSYVFPNKEWSDFVSFLAARFPERKATGWAGPFGFK